MIVADVESNGVRPFDRESRLWWVNTKVYGQPAGLHRPDKLPEARFRSFASSTIPWVFHEAQFDLAWMSTIGSRWRSALLAAPLDKFHCTRTLAHLAFPGTQNDLLSLVKNLRRRPVRDKIAPQDYASGDIDPAYMKFDLVETEGLWNDFQAVLANPAFASYYHGIAQPQIAIAARMRVRGLPFHLDEANKTQVDILEQRQDAETQLHLLGYPPDLKGSQTQKLAAWIDSRVANPLPLTPMGAPSLDARQMAEYESDSPEDARIIQAYREYSNREAARRNLQRYIDAATLSIDGRIHPGWRPNAAITDRWTCSPDNAQNIPKRGHKFGAQMRALFRPADPDFVRINADLDGAEMRLITHYSNDPTMIRTIQEGGDCHELAIDAVFNLALLTAKGAKRKRVLRELRQIAKFYNFAASYGSGIKTLDRTVKTMLTAAHLPLDLARPPCDARANWAALFPGGHTFASKMGERAKREGCVYNAYGRRIPIEPNRAYLAADYIVQSTPAAILSRAMQELESNGIPLAAQIHDEIWTLEVPRKDAPEVARLVEAALTRDSGMFRVPILADVEVIEL